MGKYTVKLLVSLVLLSSLAKAQEKCDLVFRTEKPANYSVEKELDVNYVKDFVLNENGKYEIKMVKNWAPILNQGRLGFCHWYSLYAELVREYKNRNDGRDPNLSLHYIAFHHWYRRAVETALKVDNDFKIPEGGWYDTTYNLIQEVGIKTHEQWAKLGGRTDVETAYKVDVESPQLKKLMVDSKLQLGMLEAFLKNDFKDAKSRVKYFQEIYSVGDDGPLLYLKRLVVQKSKEFKKGTTSLTKEDLQILNDLTKAYISVGKLSESQTSSLRENLRKDVIRDVQQMFAAIFFDRKEIPKEAFATAEAVDLSKEMFPEMHQTILTLSVSEGREIGPIRFLGRSKPNELNFDAPINDLASIIADQVENRNNGVWIGYNHNDAFVDGPTGAMTLHGFKWNPLNPYSDRRTRNNLEIVDGGHAVQIVGTIRAKQTKKEKAAGLPGKLLGFRIQNSWGEKVGQSGIFTMDMDYFKAFFWRITIRDESGQFAKVGLSQEVEKGKEPQFPIEAFLGKK